MTVRLDDIRGVCLDVDGVLTDGRLYVADDGRTTRAFHIHDGLAIAAFQRLGGVVLICTGKRSGAVEHRAAELGIAHVIQASQDKLADVQRVLDKLGLALFQLAMVGDDLPDVQLMQSCGWPVAVANAVAEVKAVAHYVTQRAGGQGAVREALEHLLRTTGRWTDVLDYYGAAATPRA